MQTKEVALHDERHEQLEETTKRCPRRSEASICAANFVTVGLSNNERNGSSTPVVFCTRTITCVAINE